MSTGMSRVMAFFATIGVIGFTYALWMVFAGSNQESLFDHVREMTGPQRVVYMTPEGSGSYQVDLVGRKAEGTNALRVSPEHPDYQQWDLLFHAMYGTTKPHLLENGPVVTLRQTPRRVVKDGPFDPGNYLRIVALDGLTPPTRVLYRSGGVIHSGEVNLPVGTVSQ